MAALMVDVKKKTSLGVVESANESKKSKRSSRSNKGHGSSNDKVTGKVFNVEEMEPTHHPSKYARGKSMDAHENKDRKKASEPIPMDSKRRKRNRWGSPTNGSKMDSPTSSPRKDESHAVVKETFTDEHKVASHSQVGNHTEDKKDTKITTVLKSPTSIQLTAPNTGTSIAYPDESTGSTPAIGEKGEKATVLKRVHKSLSTQDVGNKEEIPFEKRRNSAGNPEARNSSPDELSPPENPVSEILFLRNLVRPFTVIQLKDLLGKNGRYYEDKFWMDKIKSKCYVAYETKDDALKTRNALHGLRWPEANPKTLIADFATFDELSYHLELERKDASLLTSKIPQNLTQDLVGDPKLIKKVEDKENHDHLTVIKDTKDKIIDEREFVQDKRPIREWDKVKFRRGSDERRDEERHFSALTAKTKQSSSRSPVSRGSGDGPESIHRTERSSIIHGNISRSDANSKDESGLYLSGKQLDDLFKKTKALPCIYWLPLTSAESKKRQENKQELEKNFQERKTDFVERKSKFEDSTQSKRTVSPAFRRHDGSPNNRGRYFGRPRGRGSMRPYGRPSNPGRVYLNRNRSRSRSISNSRTKSRSRSLSRRRTPVRRGGRQYISRRSPRRSPIRRQIRQR